jgi:plastocyanin
MPAPRARRTALGLMLTAAAAAAGLSALATTATGARPQAVRTVTASGETLAFSKTKLGVRAGRVKLVLKNRSDIDHNIALRGRNLARAKKGKVVGRGGTSTVAFSNLRVGKYTFFCSVSGHSAAGMRGTLKVVKPS